MAKSPPSVISDCLIILSASSLWLIPLPEKIGNFWPLIKVIKPSIVEIPVWIKFLGYFLETGLIELELISRSTQASISPKSSIGLPVPSKILPNILGDNLSFKGSPIKTELTSLVSIPLVPSYTWIVVISSSNLIILPSLRSPFFKIKVTFSSNDTSLGVLINTKGPLIESSPTYWIFINKHQAFL